MATPIQHRSLPKWGAWTGGAERKRNFSFSFHLVSVYWGGVAPPWRFCRSAHEQTQAPRSWGLMLPKGAAEIFLKYTGGYAKLHGGHCYHSYAVIPKKSRVHNPESRVQNTESRVSNPESRVHSILKQHERKEVKILDLEMINYQLSKTD